MAARFQATKSEVFNRGIPSSLFLNELVVWGCAADPSVFEPNKNFDIYSKTKAELGPWESPLHRRAVMLEVLRVLGMFESSGDFKEGVDTSRLGVDTPENAEAGAWQVSYDSRHLAPELANMLVDAKIVNGIDFQKAMKFDHLFSMDYTATLLRHNTKHNGPLYKGDERLAIRRSLRGEEHSIYPWLRRDSVAEFVSLLTL